MPGLDDAAEVVEETEETEEEEAAEEAAAEEVEVEAEPEAEPETSADEEAADPQYLELTSVDYNQIKGNEAHVVFFHASWCSICKATEANILGNLGDFPDGTKIIKANYDTDIELKSQYDVQFQSSLAVVKADGSKLVTLIAPDNPTLIAAIEDSLK